MREAVAEAPGRVNLIGEHTDYHDGFVMPCAIPQRTRAHARARRDDCVRATSAEQPGVVAAFTLGAESRTGTWGDYVQGLTVALRGAGHTIHGFDLTLQSTVPVGSGLSSSAALEVSVLRALRQLFDLSLDDVTLARIGQRAEVEFVGAPVGIMDQMACSLAGEREALFLDTRSLEYERIPLPLSIELAVVNSGVTHQHAGGDYVARRRESEQAAAALGVAQLRDASEATSLAGLPPLLARRARHVITENTRVLAARQALDRSDGARFGELLNASHASLRDDYQVSVAEVDRLVALAQADPRVFGARMTGGGFGGAVVIATHAGAARQVADRVVAGVADEHRSPRATVLIPAEATT
jgi:galactokinase